MRPRLAPERFGQRGTGRPRVQSAKRLSAVPDSPVVRAPEWVVRCLHRARQELRESPRDGSQPRRGSLNTRIRRDPVTSKRSATKIDPDVITRTGAAEPDPRWVQVKRTAGRGPNRHLERQESVGIEEHVLRPEEPNAVECLVEEPHVLRHPQYAAALESLDRRSRAGWREIVLPPHRRYQASCLPKSHSCRGHTLGTPGPSGRQLFQQCPYGRQLTVVP